jgi:hypothetical protein
MQLYKILFETNAYKKFLKTNSNWGPEDEFEPLTNVRNYFVNNKLNKNGIPKYFIHFANLENLSINPQNEYGTPVGIYAYPALENLYNDFAVQSKFIHIFELKEESKILNLSEVVYEIEKRKIFQYYKDKINEYKLYGLLALAEKGSNNKNEFSKVWNFMRFIGFYLAGATEIELNQLSDNKEKIDYNFKQEIKDLRRKMTYKWNFILREVLGYDVIYDPGLGLIHVSEKTQLLVLNPKVINLVQTIENTKKNRIGNLNDFSKNMKEYKIDKNELKNIKNEAELSWLVTKIRKTAVKQILYLFDFNTENINLFIEENLEKFEKNIVTEAELKTLQNSLIYHFYKIFEYKYSINIFNRIKYLNQAPYVKSQNDLEEYVKNEKIWPLFVKEGKFFYSTKTNQVEVRI